MDSQSYYNNNYKELISAYESVSFEDVHSDILEFLPTSPSRVLDIGAGSGRDASALAKMGHTVYAVEPSEKMRELAECLHADDITWMDDALPELSKIKGLNLKFELIFLSAVWMHIKPEDRTSSFQTLVELLADNGKLIITLRIAEPDIKRCMYGVNVSEFYLLSRKFGTSLLHESSLKDKLEREGITWSSLVFLKP